MHTLDDKIDIAGEWWLTEKPDSVVSGQITFNRQDGIELNLNQAFTPPIGAIRPGDPNPHYPFVHGVTVKGEAVTLIEAQQIGTSINFGTGGFRQPGRIYARVLAIGGHLLPDFQFIKVRFRVPGLQVWLGQRVILHSMDFDENKKLTTQSFSFGRMPEEKFRLSSISALASCGYGGSSKADPYSSIKVDVSAWFTFQPDETQEIDWFLEQHEKMLTMISFLSGEAMVTDAIQAQFDDSNHRVDILFAMRGTEPPKQNHPYEFFLSRSAITVPFEEYCNKWFELSPKVNRSASLARSVMASEDIWLHMEFLSLMQALEGLHRSLYEGNYMADDQYEDVKHALTNAIPKAVASDHRDALKSRIRYGNQISLRKRLDELANKLSVTNRSNIFGKHKAAPQQWIDTRNYYTHWDEELLPNILNSQSIYYANVRMRHFIRALYSQLMGIPSSDIEKAFKGTSRVAQELIHLNIVEKRAVDPTYIPQAIMTISSEGVEEEKKNQPVEGQADNRQNEDGQ
jgi:hypothetical protein